MHRAHALLIDRQRVPCPDDPRPMPTPAITSAFVTTAGARTIGQMSCTVPRRCP